MEKVISKDGTTIAFDRSGKGQPIILVDGAFCTRSSGPMVKLAPLLSQHFTVFTYDRRGRGDSSDTAPYAVEREIEDLEALIHAAGGSAYAFGMSSGAILCLRAAASGLNMKKLALYEPPFKVGDSGGPPDDAGTQLTELTSSGRRGDAVEFFMTKVMGMPAGAVAPMRNASMWPALEAVAHTLAYDVTITGDGSLAARMASVTVSILAIDGENSPPPLRDAVKTIADILPNAQRRTLEGLTHDVAPEILAPVLEVFFSA